MNQADENWNRRASPASAPEGFALVPVVPTHAILDVMFNAGIDRHDGDLTLLYRAILAASPTPPVSEDRKDSERLDWMIQHNDASICSDGAYGPFHIWFRYSGRVAAKKKTPREAIDAAMQEDKP